VLVGVSSLGRDRPVPQCGVDLGYDRFSARWLPAIERPEVDVITELLTEVTQPGQAGVRRLCHASLNVEMKDRLGLAPLLGKSAPTRIATAAGAITTYTLTDEIYVRIILVGRPVLMKIVQKSGPIRGETVCLEVS
jgi:hypothetical protein